MATTRRVPPLLPVLAGLYAAASLVHFTHNAEFLAEYPNLPAWITRPVVYAVWLGITALGVGGFVVARTRFAPMGFLLFALYAAMGLDGLGHYALAPLAAHTTTMNLTIFAEVVAAALLLIVTLRALAADVLHRHENPRGGTATL